MPYRPKFPKPGVRKKRSAASSVKGVQGRVLQNGNASTAKRMKVWDTWFSKYIRMSACDKNGIAKCCSCGKLDMWQNMDAGHFIGRERKMTRWDERNVHPQCRYCNRFKEGRKYEYSKFLNDKYKNEFNNEVDMADYLTYLGNQNRKWLPHEVEANIVIYKGKVKELLSFFSP